MIVVANRETGRFLVDREAIERLEIECGVACLDALASECEGN